MSTSFNTASTTLSRSRGAILALTSCAAAFGIFYYYKTYAIDTQDTEDTQDSTGGSGLHRSNAVHRRRRTETSDEAIAAQLRPIPPGEDEDANIVARPLTDGDTVVNDGTEHEYEYGPTGRAPTADDERNGQNIVQLLFRVSEDATRRNAYVHRGCGCNGCGVVPIRGIRYRCANCADFDLCESCEAQGTHIKTHIFYKVKVPAPSFGPRQIQPVWYCGNPDDMERVRILPKQLMAKYSRETGFERPELEAYFEQWNFMANTNWPEDPDDIRLAMDRKTFDRCLVPSGGYRNNTPSLIFDRMFAFYDRNRDDLISFPEFLKGQAFRKQKDKWRVIFEGYDIDDDGYVDRKDFLRMFRSYYVLYRQMHRDMLEGLDEQQMMSWETHNHLNGRNALGQNLSQTNGAPNTGVELRVGEGKHMRNGDLEVHDGRGVMRPSSNDTGNRDDALLNSNLISTSSTGRAVERTRAYWRFLTDDHIEESNIDDIIEDITREQREDGDADSSSDFARDEIHNPENPFADPTESATAAFERRRRDLNITDEDVQAVCGPEHTLANIPESARPFIVKRALRRHRSKLILHERWKRRRFYTDEEEGASPPVDWNGEEDLPTDGADGEASKSQFQRRPTIHSRSSSKVRFAEDMDDFDTRSNPSTSSRSVPERWGGIEISDAERDVGKEILYQVTQQAYNELLDPLFLTKEDLAVAVLETKDERDKYRHLFSTDDFARWATAKKIEEEKSVAHGMNDIEMTDLPNIDLNPRPVWPDIPEVEVEDVRERQLHELLAATGYEVEGYNDTSTIPDADIVPHVNTIPDAVPDATPTVPESSGPAHHEFDLDSAVLDFEDSYSRDDPLRAWKYYVERDDLNLDQQRALLNALQSVLPPTLFFYLDINLKEKEEERDDTSSSLSSQKPEPEYRDPTLPQFRPNSDSITDNLSEDRTIGAPEHQSNLESSSSIPEPPITSSSPSNPKTKKQKQPSEKTHKRPSDETLYKLWEIESAEQEGKERGGLGKISYEEFERVVNKLAANGKGSSMDYLGSWIEFCIP